MKEKGPMKEKEASVSVGDWSRRKECLKKLEVGEPYMKDPNY